MSKSNPFRIERWTLSRFWALWHDAELICVCVYKRGAESVRDQLQSYHQEESPC